MDNVKRKHRTSKCLTIMLVPDGASNKIRSLKVPQWALAIIMTIAVSIGGTIAGLGAFNVYTQDKLMETAQIIEKAESEKNELINEKKQAEHQRNRIEANMNMSKNDYDEKIAHYEQQVLEIEAKLQNIAQRATESYEKMDIPGSPVSVETAQTFMGGEFNPIYNFDVTKSDEGENLDDLIETVSDEIAKTEELMDRLSEDIQAFNDYTNSIPSIWPVVGVVTSEAGGRNDPINGSYASHTGIDIKASVGTEVRATANGTVKRAEFSSGYGNLVVIDHGNGYETYYAHNSKLKVGKGDTVARGDVIAHSGNTGRTTGPHVHYEVRLYGEIKNPRDYFNE